MYVNLAKLVYTAGSILSMVYMCPFTSVHRCVYDHVQHQAAGAMSRRSPSTIVSDCAHSLQVAIEYKEPPEGFFNPSTSLLNRPQSRGQLIFIVDEALTRSDPSQLAHMQPFALIALVSFVFAQQYTLNLDCSQFPGPCNNDCYAVNQSSRM